MYFPLNIFQSIHLTKHLMKCRLILLCIHFQICSERWVINAIILIKVLQETLVKLQVKFMGVVK